MNKDYCTYMQGDLGQHTLVERVVCTASNLNNKHKY